MNSAGLNSVRSCFLGQAVPWVQAQIEGNMVTAGGVGKAEQRFGSAGELQTTLACLPCILRCMGGMAGGIAVASLGAMGVASRSMGSSVMG
jgi:hypothetical protein